MSVMPDSTNKVIDHVVFAFVYGNNCNTMTVYNAMLNICPQYTQSSADSPTESESDDTSDDYVDYEVLSESVDKTQTYMQTSQTYDQTGNYVTSETDEAGNTVTYTYDVNGNQTSVTDGEGNTTNYTYSIFGSVASVSNGEAQNTYVYNSNGDISSINHNGFSYQFNYDVFNRLVVSKIGNVTVASNTYSTNNGNLIKTTYANGDYIEYTYDDYDNVTKIKGETGVIAEFVYNKKGLIAKCIDNSSEETSVYNYNIYGSLINEYRQTYYGALTYFVGVDSDGNTVEKTSVGGQVKTITRGIDSNGNAFVSNDGVTVTNETDDFGRTTKVNTSRAANTPVYSSSYEYANGNADNTTTSLVSKLTQKYGGDELINFEYDYDYNGNIISVKQNGTQIETYAYDELNQLTVATNTVTGLYTFYTYDNAGNITKAKDYTISSTNGAPGSLVDERTYSYGDTNWKDKLTSFDGQNITYDEIGNPLNYRDGMSFSWKNGKTLTSVTTADTTINMKYNCDGLRTQKSYMSSPTSSNTVVYFYDSEKRLSGIDQNGTAMYFYYDDNGDVVSMRMNNSTYFYVKNLQGDIVKIVDDGGNVLVTYSYDAWGRIINTTDTTSFSLSTFNPFRYRGYVYDFETGLYYLQSRYYDPVTGRFINADAYFDTETGSPLSTNMFAYCENNHLNKSDPFGYWGTKWYNFKLTDEGFNVDPNFAFLSRSYCVGYAKWFIRSFGTSGIMIGRYYYRTNYKGMHFLRIAQELWFHALVYYVGKPMQTILKKIGQSWKWLDDKVRSAQKIEVDYGDNRAWIYRCVWYGATYFRIKTMLTELNVNKRILAYIIL